MDADFLPFATATDEGPDTVYSIVAGSFRSLSLVLLAFSPLNSTLGHVQTIRGFGPHQYLAATPGKDFVYTTSWATPPILSSWRVKREHVHGRLGVVNWLEHINNVPITATSSYINIPPPYTFIYSAGGPTGEVHEWDPVTGGFGKKVQQFLFVPEDELEKADKSRVALRYGSHGVEFSAAGYAFIPVLGTDSIEMYQRDPGSGELIHVSSNGSPRGSNAHDGPRHVKVHPNGKVLYCVTEHTNYVDVYDILPDSLQHVASYSILPAHLSEASAETSASDDPHTRSKHRGGTLLLTPSTPSHPAPTALFTTTRGTTPTEHGWLSIFRLDINGYIVAGNPNPGSGETQQPLSEDPSQVIRFETPTSSGKANALDVRLKTAGGQSVGVWILLTDDDKRADERGAVRVLEWDGWDGDGDHRGVRIVAEWPGAEEDHATQKNRSPQINEDQEPGTRGEHIPEFTGASHAIWLD